MNVKNSCGDAPPLPFLLLLPKVRARESTLVTMENSRCDWVSPTIAAFGRQGSFVGVRSEEVAPGVVVVVVAVVAVFDICANITLRVPGAFCVSPCCCAVAAATADDDDDNEDTSGRASWAVTVRLHLRGGGMPATVRRAFFLGGGPSGLDSGVTGVPSTESVGRGTVDELDVVAVSALSVETTETSDAETVDEPGNVVAGVLNVGSAEDKLGVVVTSTLLAVVSAGAPDTIEVAALDVVLVVIVAKAAWDIEAMVGGVGNQS